MATAAAAPPVPAPPPERADLAAWMAVAAGTLGTLMAMLDVSIVNSALPVIQGEIGASGTEGTWVATSYLVAEIIIIPLSAWLRRLLGLRTFLLTAALLFTGFSVLCGVATNLTMMIIGRIGQGLTGGAMIPTAQTIIAQRLPPSQQPIGIALFGVVAISGPVLGPLIGGWLTENLSWHFAFFINVPICIALVVLLLVGLEHEQSRLDQLGQADWFGIAGLALGLGGLTVFLEEGPREEWFESRFIVIMAITTVVGFILLMIGQFVSRTPVIKLSLLLDRQFGSVAVMGMAVGAVLFSTSYVIPQFLAVVPRYDSLQSGKVVLLAGIPSLMMMPFVPYLIRHIDIRIAVSAGLIILSVSALAETQLTILSDGSEFTLSQLMRGIGQILAMVYLSQATVQSVPPEDAGDATGLFNAIRNLGGSMAIAGVAIIQQNRLFLHERQLEETLDANSPAVQDYVAGMGRMLESAPAGLQTVASQIQQQAFVMTFNDIFLALFAITALVAPLVLFLRPLPRSAAASSGAMH